MALIQQINEVSEVITRAIAVYDSVLAYDTLTVETRSVIQGLLDNLKMIDLALQRGLDANILLREINFPEIPKIDITWPEHFELLSIVNNIKTIIDQTTAPLMAVQSEFTFGTPVDKP